MKEVRLTLPRATLAATIIRNLFVWSTLSITLAEQILCGMHRSSGSLFSPPTFGNHFFAIALTSMISF
jgi:hypothetical protein